MTNVNLRPSNYQTMVSGYFTYQDLSLEKTLNLGTVARFFPEKVNLASSTELGHVWACKVGIGKQVNVKWK